MQSLDLNNLVNVHHPLNQGRVAWFLTLPHLVGGRFWHDLMGLRQGTLTNMGNTSNGWRSPNRPGGLGHMRCDGSTGYVNSSIATGLSGSFTVAAWAKWSTLTTGIETLVTSEVSSYNNYWFSLARNGAIDSAAFGLYNGSQNPVAIVTTPFSTNQWVRMIGVRNVLSDTVELYVNGKQSASVNDTTISVPVYSALNIGRQVAPDRPFNGSMDDVSVWSRALSAAEIRADYDLSRCGYPGVLNRIERPLWATQDGILFRRTLNNRTGSRIALGVNF